MTAERFSSSLITDKLKTRFIGRIVIYYPSVASTMDLARQEAQREAVEGTVINAGEQTEGRGRMKRLWLSPRGNIALSVILYPDISSLPYLIMIASLAVAHSIEAVTGLKTQIKWPNDILIGGRKVCGILIENEVKGGRAYAIIGIGINVNLRPSDTDSIPDTATSLKDELDRNVLRADVVRRLLVEMERLYLTLPDGEHIYREWRDRLSTLGKRIGVTSGNGYFEGIAESVDSNGALILCHDDGTTTSIVAGDVTLQEK